MTTGYDRILGTGSPNFIRKLFGDSQPLSGGFLGRVGCLSLLLRLRHIPFCNPRGSVLFGTPLVLQD